MSQLGQSRTTLDSITCPYVTYFKTYCLFLEISLLIFSDGDRLQTTETTEAKLQVSEGSFKAH